MLIYCGGYIAMYTANQCSLLEWHYACQGLGSQKYSQGRQRSSLCDEIRMLASKTSDGISLHKTGVIGGHWDRLSSCTGHILAAAAAADGDADPLTLIIQLNKCLIKILERRKNTQTTNSLCRKQHPQQNIARKCNFSAYSSTGQSSWIRLDMQHNIQWMHWLKIPFTTLFAGFIFFLVPLLDILLFLLKNWVHIQFLCIFDPPTSSWSYSTLN